MAQTEQRNNRSKPQRTCKYCGTVHEPRRCLAYGRSCTSCGQANDFEQVYKSSTTWVPRDMSRERHRTDHKTYQANEEKEVSARYFDVVRSKTFNLHSIRSVIIVRLKTKTT